MPRDRDDPVRARLREAWDEAAPTPEERLVLDERFRALLDAEPDAPNVVRLPLRTAPQPVARATKPRRRMRVGVALAVAMAAALALLLRSTQRNGPAGERRAAPVEVVARAPVTSPGPWGERLLSARGRLEGRVSDAGRETVLLSGAAEFTGRHDASGSYRVSVPSLDLVIEPLGTRFVVDAESDRVRVDVQDGVVQVTCHHATRPSYSVMVRGDSWEFPSRCEENVDAALALYRTAQRLSLRPHQDDAARTEQLAVLDVLLERYADHASAPHALWMKGRALCGLRRDDEGVRALRRAQALDAHLTGDADEACRTSRAPEALPRDRREPDHGGP